LRKLLKNWANLGRLVLGNYFRLEISATLVEKSKSFVEKITQSGMSYITLQAVHLIKFS